MISFALGRRDVMGECDKCQSPLEVTYIKVNPKTVKVRVKPCAKCLRIKEMVDRG